MKKIVFALIAVLLIGTFVACDGEADFLLWDNEPAGPKILKLKINDDWYSFEGGWPRVGEIELAVDGSVKTWDDLIKQSFDIPLFYRVSISYEPFPVVWNTSSDYVELLHGSFPIYVLKPAGEDYVDIVKTEDIDFDSQYLLAIPT